MAYFCISVYNPVLIEKSLNYTSCMRYCFCIYNVIHLLDSVIPEFQILKTFSYLFNTRLSLYGIAPVNAYQVLSHQLFCASSIWFYFPKFSLSMGLLCSEQLSVFVILNTLLFTLVIGCFRYQKIIRLPPEIPKECMDGKRKRSEGEVWSTENYTCTCVYSEEQYRWNFYCIRIGCEDVNGRRWGFGKTAHLNERPCVCSKGAKIHSLTRYAWKCRN